MSCSDNGYEDKDGDYLTHCDMTFVLALISAFFQSRAAAGTATTTCACAVSRASTSTRGSCSDLFSAFSSVALCLPRVFNVCFVICRYKELGANGEVAHQHPALHRRLSDTPHDEPLFTSAPRRWCRLESVGWARITVSGDTLFLIAQAHVSDLARASALCFCLFFCA